MFMPCPNCECNVIHVVLPQTHVGIQAASAWHLGICNLMQVLPATVWTLDLDNLLLGAGAAPNAVNMLRMLWQRSEIGREACKLIAQPLNMMKPSQGYEHMHCDSTLSRCSLLCQ